MEYGYRKMVDEKRLKKNDGWKTVIEKWWMKNSYKKMVDEKRWLKIYIWTTVVDKQW